MAAAPHIFEGSQPAERPTRRPGIDISRAQPLRVWSGVALRAPCDLCGELIVPPDSECEVEATLEGAPATLHFHTVCYNLWQVQLQARGRSRLA